MNIKIFIRRIRNFIYSNIGKIEYLLRNKRKHNSVDFIVEDADWAIKRVGDYICDELIKISNLKIKTSTKPSRAFGKVIHFGSQYMWVDWGQYLSKNHHYVVSFFHGSHEDGPDIAKHIEEFLKSESKISKIIVSNSIVENRLKKWGVPELKIIRIPIGVDMKLFNIPNNSQYNEARKFYNLPNDSIVIGSFQKDGVGWGNGMQPKNVKGPDIFLQTLNQIRELFNISVLLTGPARGYVIAGLEEMGIPYTHKYIEKYDDLVQCYHALDLYLISSREEGGPMALMEGMASGVPIVSTPVGMAEDFIINGINGSISKHISSKSLTESLVKTINLIQKGKLKKGDARRNIRPCSWPNVAKSHLDTIYQPLLNQSK